MVQNGELKVAKNENQNRWYGSNKNGANNGGKPQIN